MKRSCNRVEQSFAITLTALAYLSPVMFAQSSTSSSEAANAWQSIPTLYSAHDSPNVPAQVRMNRDRYWDASGAGSRTPLDPKTSHLVAFTSDYGAGRNEIPDNIPNRTIVVATFTNAQSILTASGRCVYTDISFQVEQTFESAAGSVTNPGSTITVSVPGGTVQTASGEFMSYLVQPRRLFLQPFHRYLLVLSYQSAGDFFLSAAEWDIVDGTLHANDRFSYALARSGKSWVEGLSIAQFSRALPAHIKSK